MRRGILAGESSPPPADDNLVRILLRARGIGLAVLVAGALVVAHRSEGEELARLVAHVHPAWLLLGLLLQAGTCLVEARIWQRIIVRAGISRPLWSYMGLSLAKLFMDQVVPSGGMSGTLLVVRALDRRGIPRGTSMASVVVDLVSYYGAYVAALVIALVVVWLHGSLTLYIILPAAIFARIAAGIPVVLVLMSRGGLRLFAMYANVTDRRPNPRARDLPIKNRSRVRGREAWEDA